MQFSSLLQMWEGKKRENRLKKFYARQQDLVDSWKADEEMLKVEMEARDHEGEQNVKKWDTRIASIVLCINVVLIIGKIAAAILSHSLSVIASVVDSGMDILAGMVLYFTCRAIENHNKHHYPVGLNRLEPLATIVFGMVMIFANLIVYEEAISGCISGNLHPVVDIETLVILCINFGIKLVLYLICRVRKSQSCQVLAIDQRNDCVTNLVALAGAYIGHRWWKYSDPIGAFLVSGFVIFTWLQQIREQVPMLIGKSASPDFIHRIINVSITHDERIQNLDMIYVYHLGANFLVELHIVLDKELPLKDAHDISESLQTKLERLPYVERAFVHCDYEFDGDEHL
ncbi:hypothetical protein WR25_04028 [Diploscapter pachys]|uniref:Uncharacterized protein n=1 Tax=Diploscapter pachys TaxID=2018661 RepID=A0A2A2KLM4_9BILA|nr:hypothetical protein WR25_04028 [Diploscapter pachys]